MTCHVHPASGGHATARRSAPAEQSARDEAAALDGTLLETGRTRESRVGRDVLDRIWIGPKRSLCASAGPLCSVHPPHHGVRNSTGMFICRKRPICDASLPFAG